MGQYHYPINWNRREYLDPHTFGDGLKLLEFGCSQNSTLTGLAVLLASSNKGGARGGGDLHPWHDADRFGSDRVDDYIIDEDYEQRLMNHVVGRWAGQRIQILGDYHNADETCGEGTGDQPWNSGPMGDRWTNIGAAVLQTMRLDHYLRHDDTGITTPTQELVSADGVIREETR